MRLWSLGLLFLLSACTTCQFPYRPTVTQGFAFSQSQIDKLVVGMDRSEVQWILGAPILKDSGNPHRMTYYYSVACGGKLVAWQKWVLYFSGDLLQKVERFTHKNPQAEILLPKTNAQ